MLLSTVLFFFFNDTATTEIYTLSLHDALPIFVEPTKDVATSAMAPPESLAAYFGVSFLSLAAGGSLGNWAGGWLFDVDRKSTRLNSSHANISYAVFCLKKKNM